MSGEKKKHRISDVVEKYHYLVSERRYLGAKLAELELDLEEHKLVAEALKGVDNSRKCFRMVGGILCQLTVRDVLPIIGSNAEQIGKFIEEITHDIDEKDKEIQAYKQKFSDDLKDQDKIAENVKDDQKHRVGGVLVAK